MEEQFNQQTVMCPVCGSTSLAANTGGFNSNKAAVGAFVAGPIGLLAGATKMNKIDIVCLQCGTEFKPGEGATSVEQLAQKKRELNERKDLERRNKAIRFTIAAAIIVCIIAWFYSKFLY